MRRTPKAKLSEVQIASVLTTHLKESGWSVYEEVSFGEGSSVDIIAVREPLVAAIEVKTSFNMTVLGQAKRWLYQAHLTYVAVPRLGRNEDGARWVCQTLGIGLFEIGATSVREIVRPNFCKTAKTQSIRKYLHPVQLDGSIPAGSPGGFRWTPWRRTVDALVAEVRANPGILLRDALTAHHYRTDKLARASLSHQIRKGIIKELRFDDGKLYPVEKK